MDDRYGVLLTPDIKLHRQWFSEFVSLYGIQTYYRAPKPGKSYTTYTEIESNYDEPEKVGVIFDEHPTQQTMKKIGWVSELQDAPPIMHVPYDLKGLQQGALFYIPSGLDNASARLFRVIKLTNGIIYPASITCQVAPEFENSYSTEQQNYKHSSFNHLAQEDDYI